MNRMLLLALLAISLIKTSQCVRTTRLPVRHAEILHDLLSHFLGDSYSNNVLFDYIMGKPSQHPNNLTGENLDINTLDVNNLKKIIAFAKTKHMNEILMGINARRAPYVKYPRNEIKKWHPYIVNKTLDLMRHSIYMTNEKINLTKPFRKKYNRFYSYQIAVLYGAAAALLAKLESFVARIHHFWDQTHFIWHLILYEKSLAAYIDISDSIEKLFIIQGMHETMRGSVDPKLSAGSTNLSKAQIQKMLKNPEMAKEFGYKAPKS